MFIIEKIDFKFCNFVVNGFFFIVLELYMIFLKFGNNIDYIKETKFFGRSYYVSLFSDFVIELIIFVSYFEYFVSELES